MNFAPTPTPRLRWLLPLAVAIASLWPFVHNWTVFHSFFYFQDEWDQIDQWDKTGFGVWCLTDFAENFVPIFKAFWGGAIIGFSGSYFALLVVLWLTHAINTLLVTRISMRVGAGPAGAILAGLVFGVAWINYETLTWTVQWSAVLSLSFFLLGVDFLAGTCETGGNIPWRRTAAALSFCVLASALCFVRGVIAGPALAAWVLVAPESRNRWREKIGAAAAAMAPALFVTWWIFRHSSGNHQHLAGVGTPMIRFALYYFAQSPLRTLWSNETPELPAIIWLAIAKTAIFGLGLWLAPRNQRAVLATLWLFEIGNALLLGLGRYHTGLPASGSSRYQYGALATLLPFCGVLFHRLVMAITGRFGLRPTVAAVLILGMAWQVERPWPTFLKDWVLNRGVSLRRDLFETPLASAPPHFTQLPWMSNERAHELAAKYNLH